MDGGEQQVAAGGRIRTAWRHGRGIGPVGALAGRREGGRRVRHDGADGGRGVPDGGRAQAHQQPGFVLDLAGRSIPGDLVAGEVGVDAWLGTFLRA